MKININVKQFSEDAKIPQYQTKGAAGFDFHAAEKLTVLPGQVVAVKTGLGFDIPEGREIQVRSRSGLALKKNIFVLNAPGTIDSDYKEEVKIILCNASNQNFSIAIGDRIAQGVLCEVDEAVLTVVSELQNSERQGGFGSTGIN